MGKAQSIRMRCSGLGLAAAGLLLCGLAQSALAQTCTTVVVDAGGIEFRGIDGSSDTNVFAVGKDGTIYHYDGSGWTDQTADNNDPNLEDLRDVHAVDTSVAFAVGKGGVILEYDGTDWDLGTLDTATDKEFKGVWAASSTEAFAVGKDGTVYMFDGTDWSDQSGAAGTGNGDDFEDAWGDADDFYGLTKSGTLFHFDLGTSSWDAGPITTCDIDNDLTFKDLWGDASGDLFLAGKDKRPNPDEAVVYQYDVSAGTCTEVGSTTAINKFEGISGSIGTGPGGGNEIYAVGKKGNYLYSDDGGATWTALAVAAPGDEDQKDVWVSGTGKTFIAGKKGQWSYCALATNAELGEVTAYRSAVVGSVVEWQTFSERGTLGFHVLREDPQSGEYIRLNTQLLPGLVYSRLGGSYRFLDATAEPGQLYRYKLVEVEAAGTKRSYGPFEVRVQMTPPPRGDEFFVPMIESTLGEIFGDVDGEEPVTVFEQAESPPSAVSEARTTAKKKARKTAEDEKVARTGKAVKITLREPGIYYVHAASLAKPLGIPEATVSQLIGNRGLAVTNRGAPVAIHPAPGNAGFYFYGEAIESQYTEDNVYWLYQGEGLAMQGRNGAAPAAVSAGAFVDTAHAEGNNYHLTHFFDDPDADYWMWDFVFPGYFDTRSFSIASPGALRESELNATLTVRVTGGSDSPLALDHHAAIVINGVPACTARWAGTTSHEAVCEVPMSVLLDGDNAVEVTGYSNHMTDQPSVFFVNNLELGYLRRYESLESRLAGATAGHRVVSVDGFGSDDIRVFDLEDPRRPRVVANASVDGVDGDYRVSFEAEKQSTPFIALTPDGMLTPASIVADIPSSLMDTSRRADWLLITASDLLDAAAGLADYRRRSQGLTTLVVDVEDIYDEFNDGIRDVDAIWQFLRYAHTRWQRGPRYVVLAGEGSFDYKNYLGFGDAIIPTLLTPTPRGLYPSDNLLADVLGNDFVPEMAIGRLPVIDSAEMRAVTAKLIAYESADGSWTERSVLSADAPDNAGNFAQDSDRIAALIPPDLMDIETIHVDPIGLPPDVARQQMLDAMDRGNAFVNFYGHGGFLGLGNADLLKAGDVPLMVNRGRLPVVTAFTCLSGQFGFPGQESVGEVLMVQPEVGAAGVWAPSGLSLHALARTLGEGFYAATFQDGELIVGEAILKAQASYARTGMDRYLLDIYNFIGDPATVMK